MAQGVDPEFKPQYSKKKKKKAQKRSFLLLGEVICGRLKSSEKIIK
jgi:hypothetical protein